MKRLITGILLLAMLATLSTAAYARYSYIETLTAGLKITNGVAACSGSVNPSQSGYGSSVTVTLKQKVGSSWVTYGDPWSASGTGIGGASISKTRNVESGTSYKVVVTGKITSGGSTLESDTMESTIRSY